MLRRAFSLIELLVVLSILGVLIGLLLPAVQSARATAQRTACQNTMKQIGLALHNYESAHGRFPCNDSSPQTLSWFVHILPHVDQEPLYRISVAATAIQADPTLSPHTGFSTPIKAFSCPADGRLGDPHDFEGKRAAFGSYLGVSTVSYPGTIRSAAGVFYGSPGPRVTAITDGTSNTVAVVERPPPANFQAGWWYPSASYWGRSGPHTDLSIGGESRVVVSGENCSVQKPFGPGRLDNPCDRLRVWSLHPSGANFLFADGAVRFLGYGFATVLPAASTIAGGEVLPMFE